MRVRVALQRTAGRWRSPRTGASLGPGPLWPQYVPHTAMEWHDNKTELSKPRLGRFLESTSMFRACSVSSSKLRMESYAPKKEVDACRDLPGVAADPALHWLSHGRHCSSCCSSPPPRLSSFSTPTSTCREPFNFKTVGGQFDFVPARTPHGANVYVGRRRNHDELPTRNNLPLHVVAFHASLERKPACL